MISNGGNSSSGKDSGFLIGDVSISPRLILAPMEDVTNIAFRQITKEIANPGLVVTEFVSAMAMHYNPNRAVKKMSLSVEEHPISIQIFGGDCETMAVAARKAEEIGADIVDINMGCWVPKVCRTGAGAALLKDPERAKNIVKAVVDAVKVPVSVKVRAGWDYTLFSSPDLVESFQDVGAKMITLHARFAKQGFDGEADWRLIHAIRNRVKVPLVGNGDINSPDDCLKMIRETGCDGVMVGRAAISNPWLVKNMVSAMEGCNVFIQPTLADRIEVALRHLRLLINFEQMHDLNPFEAEARACRALRGQMPLYMKGFNGASAIRQSLGKCSSYNEYEETFRKFEVDSNLSDKILTSSI